MPPADFNVHKDGAGLFEGQQMLGHTGLAGTDGRNNIPTRRWSVSRKVSEDLVPRPVAERRNGSLDVRRPCVVLGLRNPWHESIVAEHDEKSKKRTLDDTLIIFDNIFHRLFPSWLKAIFRPH